MKERMLLTGGSGLLSTNFAVVGRDKYNIVLGLNNKIISIKNVKSVKLNLVSKEKLQTQIRELRINIIIHNAGLTSVENCEKNPSLAFMVNFELAKLLADVCKELDILLVYISTDHLFDGKSSFATENKKLNPINYYAKSKALAEEYISNMCKKKIIIRTNFFCWGPSYRWSFSDKIIYTLENKEKIFLFQDVFFTPILASVLFDCLSYLIDRENFGIYNIVSSERLTKYEFGIMLAKKFKLNTSLISKNKLSLSHHLTKRPYDMSLSNKKILSNIPFEIPKISDQIDLLKFQCKDSRFKEIINLC